MLVFLPLLVWLGFWQLDRAEEKQVQQSRWETLSPVGWPLPAGRAAEGQPVIIEGRFMPERQWLLDNRTRNGQAGYEVLSLFKPRGLPPVVINRGWIAGTGDRAALPEIPLTADRQRLKARVANWPEPPVIGAVEREGGWPRRIQSLTPELAAASSGAPVSEVFLRLANERQPGALKADWAPARMGAETHYGYAVQWFGLALALTILSIVASFRESRSTDISHD